MKENSIIYKKIDPKDIQVISGFNQRLDFGDIDELAAQIKEQGLLEAISVVPYKDENGQEKYLLINGERRFRAISKLIDDGVDVGLIKANILPQNLNDEELFTQQFMRNEGKKFTEIELAHVCKKLKDLGCTNSDIAKKLGKNPGVITYALQMLDYDPRIVEMLENGEICGSDVRRVYTAARKKYGQDEWEAKANEEILAQRKKTVDTTDKEDAPVKVSIKESDLYGDVKDSKAFFSGIKVFINYCSHYERKAGHELDADLFEMYLRMKSDSKLTLRDLFEELMAEEKKEAR
jgi:ParB family chromosome partitioning protein